MHIADGVIPLSVCLVADAAALGLASFSGRKLQAEEVPRLGLCAATLFVVSLVHFPLGGTSLHLGLYGLAGMLLGRRVFPVVFINLLFQSLIFQHGGLLSLGVNTLTMGSGAYLAGVIHEHLTGWPKWSAFCCGFIGIFVPALLVALLFLLLHYGRGTYLFLALYVPAAFLEGAITVLVARFFARVQPEILRR